jgi:hypothetical protein
MLCGPIQGRQPPGIKAGMPPLPAPSSISVRPAHLWGPGQSGNPAGRPKGSKNKLSEDFVADLYDDWKQRGPSVIARVAEERPHEYLKIIASLLPKDVNLKANTLEDMSDDQLMRKLASLTEMAKPLLARLPAVIDATPVRADAGAETNTERKYINLSNT